MTRSKSIALVDSGCANIGSLVSILDYCGYDWTLVTSSNASGDYYGMILPGVGSFDNFMSSISVGSRLGDFVRNSIFQTKIPCLGICVGMQALALSSEEGVMPGLGVIPQQVVKLSDESPSVNMGWRTVTGQGDVFDTFPSVSSEFYFVHSFGYRSVDSTYCKAVSQFRGPVAALVGHENILGVQFHPERSGIAGIRFFEEFLEACK